MNIWNRLSRMIIGSISMLSVAALCASSAIAQPVTFLSSQGFTTNALPSGWSANWGTDNQPSGYWFWNSVGNGGSNGSAMDDIWDYDYTAMATPPVNASAYAHGSDMVWVDFDFFWEYNNYCTNNTNDEINIDANSDVLVSGTEATLYTYYNTSDANYDVAQTSSSYWRHYHILIPPADRTSNMTINWSFITGQGISDIAIDNVTITGFFVAPSELSLEPHSYNFGTATPSQADTLFATVKSLGPATLNIASYGISGASAYTVVAGPAPGTAMLPNTSAQYVIQFLPLTSGPLTGTFTLNTDGADSGTQIIALTGVGAVPNVSYGGITTLFHGVHTPLGDTSAVQYVPVTSNGIGPLSFNKISFIGLNPTNYIITRMPKNPLPTGTTDSIGIRFTPNVEGRPDASLVISTTAANIPLDTVTLFGIGVLPHLEITLPPPSTGNTLAFDSVALGDSVCQTMTLTNPGTDTLRLLHQLLTSGDYDFSFYPLTGADTMIVPGGTKLVNVCFKPLKNGFREASIRFSTNIRPTFTNPPKDTSQFAINVTGIGVPYGILEISGPVIDTALIGKSNCVVDTFWNSGLSALTVNSASISGPSSSNFNITSGAPFTLTPGQKMNVTICYDPSSGGAQVDTILVNGVSSEHNFTSAVEFTGYGATICASTSIQWPLRIPLDGGALTFGVDSMTLVSKTNLDTVIVTNCGDYPSSYTGTITVGSSTYSLLPNSISLVDPGGEEFFIVQFSPAAIGAATGNLQITGTEGPVAPIDVPLDGVGAGVVATASGSPASAVPLGACDTFSVTVTNNGNYPWTPGSGTISGTNASDFTIVSGPTPTAIPASGTGTVMVSFCPTKIGAENMTLTFPNGSPTPIPAFTYSPSGVGAASGVALRAEQDGFVLGQSYPNPTNGMAEVSFTLPNDATVSIALMDLTGQTVQSVFTGNLSSGDHTLPISAKGLPSGTYFYTLTSGDVQLTRQMTIVK